MWSTARKELREVVYLGAMVSGLATFRVGLAVVLVLAGIA
jgi:hypothetical protein